MKAVIKEMMHASLAFAARESVWLSSDRHGRWVVIEPGAGHYLTDSPEHVRRYVDALTPRRARRFSSLSRARAFARLVNSRVQRWRRQPPGGGVWRRRSPWKCAVSRTSSWLRYLTILSSETRRVEEP